MFTKSSLAWSVRQLVKAIEAQLMRYDLEVQRRSVWNKKQKQELIYSILFNYVIPPLILVDKGVTVEEEVTTVSKKKGAKKQPNKVISVLWLVDGQQRGRTIHEFSNDKFPIAKDVETYIDVDGTEYEVAGKFYSELPTEVKSNFNSTSLQTNTIVGMTDEQIAKQFRFLQNGTAMRGIEKTRTLMHNELAQLVNVLSEHQFFTEKVLLTAAGKNHFIDQEVILQTLMLLSDVETGISGAEIAKYVKSFKDTESTWHSEDFMTLYGRIVEITNYLNDVFDVKYKYLKKTNLPVIFKVAEIAMQNSVSSKDFWLWADRFYETLKPESAYTLTCTSNSAKKESVQKRYKLLKADYVKNIVKTEVVVRPTICTEPDEGTEPIEEGTEPTETVVDTVIEPDTSTEPTSEPIEETTKKTAEETTEETTEPVTEPVTEPTIEPKPKAKAKAKPKAKSTTKTKSRARKKVGEVAK